MTRNEVNGGTNNQQVVQTSKDSLKLDRKENDSESCGENEDAVRSLFCVLSESKNSNQFEESIDDLVLINSPWSDDVDLDSLLKHCVQLPRKVKRSRTEEIPVRDLNRWRTSLNNIKISKNCKKIRSQSLPGLENKFPLSLSINRENDTKRKVFEASGHRTQNFTSDVNANFFISDENVDSLLDMLEESKV